ncbi:MAG: AAA family ATPase [Bacteroidota bacterium]
MNTVMIYEVKSSAAANAKLHLDRENDFFYWSETRFKKLQTGDFVFVVNKVGGFLLFTQLDKTGIPAAYDTINQISTFVDEGKSFEIDGEWKRFVRLKILQEKPTPPGWKWKSLGNSETTYLLKEKFVLTENNILRARNILEVFQEEGSPAHQLLTQLLGGEKGWAVGLQNAAMIAQVLTAIQTKPFLLLAGISGTGKSRLVRTLAYKTCWKKELRKAQPANYALIPVRPNWHDSSELLGYVSRISGEPQYVTTKLLRFLVEAWKHQEVPFFLCLDEMNLAPVEQYFAEFLSILETRRSQDGEVLSDPILSLDAFTSSVVFENLLRDLAVEEGSALWTNFVENGIALPPNLVVMGTVNMDETTHSFSRKVLDRAMTFEMNQVDLEAGLEGGTLDWAYPDVFIPFEAVVGPYTSAAAVYPRLGVAGEQIINYLKQVNQILNHTPFKVAYRVRDEFLIYAYHKSQSSEKLNWCDEAIDEMTSMKILSRIEGDENRTGEILEEFRTLFEEQYPQSFAKVEEMIRKLQSGYTSFWS